MDPARKRKKNRDHRVQGAGLKPLEMEYYRLNPKGGVLERKVNMAIAVIWVPVIPDDMMKFLAKPQPWRKWLFDQLHLTFLHPHRPLAATYQYFKRTAYWDSMNSNVTDWYLECETCLQHR